MHRFFVAPELLTSLDRSSPGKVTISNQSITLPEMLAHQVRDVLHLGIGEQLVLLDNSGDEVLASILKSNRAGVEAQLLERRAGKNESTVRVILCQGLLKSARFEWILEKGTELGVTVFAPILCQRSMAGLEDAGSSKLKRWQRIIQEAAEQCGRSRLPELLPIRPLLHALNTIPPGALALMPWEEEHGQSLREALTSNWNIQVSTKGDQVTTTQSPPAVQPVVIFIGPEGGLMAEEVNLARRHGVQVVTLGQRVLRAETAALVTVANVMYAWEA